METNRCHCCYIFGINNAKQYFAISEIVPGCTSVPATPKPANVYFSFPARQVPAGINKRKSRKPPTTRFRTISNRFEQMPIPSSALYREIPATGLYDNVPRLLKHLDRADPRYTLEREIFEKCLGQKVVIIRRLKYAEWAQVKYIYATQKQHDYESTWSFYGFLWTQLPFRTP